MAQSPDLPSLLEALSCLADDTRLRLLRLLEQHELGVGELGQVLRLPQPTVSRHLKTLSEAGFVSSRREGTSNLYRMLTAELSGTHRDLWQVARDRSSGWAELEQDGLRLAELLKEKRSSSREFFAGAAAEWDRLRAELYGDAFTTAAMLSLLPRTTVVVDLACGTGSTSAALAPYVARVEAIDNSPEMLAAARSRCAGLANVTIHDADLTAVPLASGSCDAALLLLALTYLPEAGPALSEAARVLKPGGVLTVVDLLPHGRDDFRRKMNQLHAGLAPDQVRASLKEAGLDPTGLAPLASPPETKGPGLFLATAMKPR